MAGEPKPTRDEATIRAFVENFSLMLAERGVPRMAARVSTVMMAAEEDSLTAADLAERLGVSPAAVSGALKYLLHVGLFERESIPNSRRDRYRFGDDNWYSASILKMDFMDRIADEVDKAVDSVGGPETHAGRRMAEMSGFYRFVTGELHHMYERWQEHKKDMHARMRNHIRKPESPASAK